MDGTPSGLATVFVLLGALVWVVWPGRFRRSDEVTTKARRDAAMRKHS